MINTDPRHRRLVLGAGLGSLLIALAACSTATSSTPPAATQTAGESSSAASESSAASMSAAESTPAGPTLTITGTSSFGESEITVPAGEQLTVVNDSTFPHTFTEGQNGGQVANPRVNEQIAVGASMPITFPEPGDYNVTCLFHSSMNVVVHVE